MFLKYTVNFVLLLDSVFSMHSSKEMEGYPAGFLSDCPGSNVTVPIRKQYLKNLTMVVQGDGYILPRRKKYNYHQMRNLSQDPDVDFSKKTLLYVAGYLESTNDPFGLLSGVAYKTLGYNFFLLDPIAFTRDLSYPVAARNMRAIGMHIAEMLVELMKYGLDPKQLEIVGLSLGGHTIGFVAKNFRQMTGMNISRATGIDPAGPCFRNLGPEDRLDDSDADFVDVIHANIDDYGMAAPIGHVNFYINGGEYQPADVIWIATNAFTSHLRALTIWIAALYNPNKFIALKCDSVQQARNRNCYDRKQLETNVLGLNTDMKNQGIFYLATENNYPYFLGEKGLRKDHEFFDRQLNLLRRRPNVVKKWIAPYNVSDLNN